MAIRYLSSAIYFSFESSSALSLGFFVFESAPMDDKDADGRSKGPGVVCETIFASLLRVATVSERRLVPNIDL